MELLVILPLESLESGRTDYEPEQLDKPECMLGLHPKVLHEN